MAHQTSAPALTGSCYCGAVRYSSKSMPIALTACHCIACRKLHGGPFATFADIASDDLTWTSRDQLKEIQTSPVAVRGFCRECGSIMFMRYDWESDLTGMAAGTIDEKSLGNGQRLPKLEAHIFTDFKADWYPLTDGLPQYKRHKPEADERMDAWDGQHGVLKG